MGVVSSKYRRLSGSPDRFADLANISVVINPAERNALVGIKPTVGLTSRAGYNPTFVLSSQYDS